jgi:hypothetical protein
VGKTFLGEWERKNEIENEKKLQKVDLVNIKQK